jgi:uncharacterized membrane protein
MTTHTLILVCMALGLSSALVAGVFLAFSDFVMRGLIAAEAGGGIDSMQQLNRTVMRSVFLTTFLALVPATIGMAGYAWLKLSGPGQALLIAAAVIYVVTVFLVTVAGNVPMNERLDTFAHASADAQTYWLTYGRVWTWWNHVRTGGSILTAVCFMWAAVAFK